MKRTIRLDLLVLAIAFVVRVAVGAGMAQDSLPTDDAKAVLAINP